jgi:hypothetical protein
MAQRAQETRMKRFTIATMMMLTMMFTTTTHAKVEILDTVAKAKAFLAVGTPMILMLGSDSCSGCKMSFPDFEATSNKFSNVRFGYLKVDRIRIKELRGKYDYIPSYVAGSTEAELRSGKYLNTNEDRDVSGLVNYITKTLCLMPNK